jgi:butyrate kinase
MIKLTGDQSSRREAISHELAQQAVGRKELRLPESFDRLTGLMEHKVHFVVAALGRDCDNFTLHIYASLRAA